MRKMVSQIGQQQMFVIGGEIMNVPGMNAVIPAQWIWYQEIFMAISGIMADVQSVRHVMLPM